ncbi:hypothetical protein [Glaciimonas sp. PAMC28666]|uniref:hypothetical protein n=1 Tax=Glaciimonas sp. PAMC28666 TaxID=2807626 RepID=UPI0019632F1D|nr:hypothetical protein [Glaciimonas sp. PAMC28666]QRX83418.1 hypothetical protein JQN73_03935 [Glaciimonas sp. PAMC28666]
MSEGNFIDAEAVLSKEACSAQQAATQFITLIGKLHTAEPRGSTLTTPQRQHLRIKDSTTVLTVIKVLPAHHLARIAPSR